MKYNDARHTKFGEHRKHFIAVFPAVDAVLVLHDRNVAGIEETCRIHLAAWMPIDQLANNVRASADYRRNRNPGRVDHLHYLCVGSKRFDHRCSERFGKCGEATSRWWVGAQKSKLRQRGGPFAPSRTKFSGVARDVCQEASPVGLRPQCRDPVTPLLTISPQRAL